MLFHSCTRSLCIIQFCIQSNTCPSIWKLSYVTLLHKSGSTSNMANYRPIKTLPKLSVLFERVLFDFIYPEINLLINEKQHSFMKNRSTTTQLLAFLGAIFNCKDEKILCSSVYFDFHSIQFAIIYFCENSVYLVLLPKSLF